MKILLTFLFTLLFCFNAVARESHYMYSCEVKQNDVATYKKEIKKCDQSFYNGCKIAETTAQTLKILRTKCYVAACYEDIAYKIIDKYYSKSAKEQKEAFAKYGQQIYKTFESMYVGADECGISGCGLISYVFSINAGRERLKSVVERYIWLLEDSLYYCKKS